ncbi:hypothetical protein HWV62_17684 [Athelia sp. TMB]|nr:hypothetical protein HWV62_17684 [Athelia sp. TMB]
MFAFAPSAVYDPTPLVQPRRHYLEARPSSLHASNPRGRYLAALAEAEAAEAEYVAAIAKEKALQRLKEEEGAAAIRREAAALQRQKSDALRRQAVFDALYAQEDSFPTHTYHTGTPIAASRYHPSPRFDSQSDEEALILRELERRRALALRRQEEEREAARVAAVLEAQKREALEAKLRQCSDEDLLGLLSGSGRATVRKVPSQEKLSPQFPPVISQLINTIAEPPRYPASEPSKQPQSPADALLSAIFGGSHEQNEQPQQVRCLSIHTLAAHANRLPCYQPHHCRHVSFAEPPQQPSSRAGVAPTPTSAPAATPSNVASLIDILNRGVNQETQDNIFTTLQSLFGPNLRVNEAQSKESTSTAAAASAPVPTAKAETSAPAPQPAAAPTPSAAAPASSAAGALKNLLQARLDTESETEVRDTLQGLLGSIFNGASQSRPAREPQAAPPSAPATTSNSGLSLKEQLEARLHRGPNAELHDTIKAIFASMAGPAAAHAPAATPASASASSSSPATAGAAASASTPDEGKGKGKADTTTPASTTTANPTSKDVVDSMNAIHSIEAHFAVLASEFSFPSRLEFTPPSSRPSSPSPSSSLTSNLAYTSANAPVRYYEQALSALLVQLDAVESHGNEDVRKARKEVVARVEGALEEVEREVRERFVQREARNAAAQPQAVEQNDEAKEKLEAEELVEAEKPVSADEAVAEEPVVVDEPIESVVENTEPLATPVADIEVPESKDERPEQVAEVDTSEEPVSEPVAVPASPTVEHSRLTVESFNLPSGLDSHNPPDDDLVPAATQSVPESLESSVSTVTFDTTPAPSYPPTTKAEPEPETVDTFLLPNQSPVTPKRPTASNDEEEPVVVDTHSEGDWSEVEA